MLSLLRMVEELSPRFRKTGPLALVGFWICSKGRPPEPGDTVSQSDLTLQAEMKGLTPLHIWSTESSLVWLEIPTSAFLRPPVLAPNMFGYVPHSSAKRDGGPSP